MYIEHQQLKKEYAKLEPMNPTMHMFKDALDRLRRMCKKRSYLMIYLSTHILTIHSKEKEFKGEDCFICFKDTVWKNSTLAAQTSMPWSAFAASLNSILAEEKVVSVNFCHNKAPQKSIFKSRYLYPPPDCLTRLADMANCAVMGSCNFGSQISSMQAHMPPSPTDVIEEMVKDQTDDDASQVSMDSVQKVESSVASSKRRAKDSAISPMDDILPNNKSDQTTLYNTDIVKNYQKEWLRDLNLKSVTKPVKPTKPGLRWKKVPTEAELAAAAALEAKGNTEDDQGEEKQNDDDSSVASGKRDVFAKKKVKKAAKVRVVDEVEEEELKKKTREKTQDELDLEAGLALGVQMSLPTKYDFWGYSASLKVFKVKKAMFPAIRAYTNHSNARKLSSGGAPCQRSLKTKKKYSLFGRIFIDAITGNLKIRSGNHISAKEVFLYIHQHMRKGIRHLTEPDDEGLFPRQDPVLFVPTNNLDAADNPVCCVCGPPAAPEAPFVVRLGMNSVLLEWDLVPFDGVGPTKYRIYMRNNTKLFYDWTVATGCENIEHIPGCSSMRWNVNYLPLGVPTEFCVAAANIGGWSKLSLPSVTATPGEDLVPHTAQKTWKIISQGGPLAILDRLAKYPQHRHDHLTGFRYLIVYAQREGAGYSRLNIKEKASQACMKALRTFPLDDEICTGAFTILGYCLQGYMFKKLTMGLIKDGLIELIDSHIRQYRNDTRVMNAVLWLNRALPAGKLHYPDQTPLPFQSDFVDDEEEED